MSFLTEVNRLKDAKEAIKEVLLNKGIDVSTHDKLDDYAEYIDMISIGTPVSMPVNYSTWTYNKYGQITSFTTKSSVTSIGDSAFYWCESLTSVSLPNVTFIDGYAFCDCKSLTSVSLPNVEEIGLEAFGWCTSLVSVDIGQNVTSIDEYAFDSPTSVTCRATTPPTIGNNAFYDTSEDLVIYVPAESVEAYKTATNWSTYADRIQAIP